MILITGNLGYLGSVLVEHLRRKYPARPLLGLDAGYFSACLLDPKAEPERALSRQILGDIRDVNERMLSGVESVIHLAALSNDPIGSAFEKATAAVNEAATVRLAIVAKRAGVSNFAFASSCSVYGFSEGKFCDERSAVRPLTAYARSKAHAEMRLAQLACPEFRVTCLRFATACGLSPRLRLDLVLNDFVASAFLNGAIQILSDGSAWRPLIDVEDMSRALDWAISREACKGRDYLVVNAGSQAWNFQIRDLAEAVALELGGTRIEFAQNAPGDCRSYRVSFKLFRELAGEYRPQVTLAECIRRIRAGLEASGFQEREFRKSRFMRLNVLNRYCEHGLLDRELRWREDAAA